MKKTLRKIIPALVMLMISAMLVGTSTYAWFAMNQKVTVTGMKVNTHVGSNLSISTTNESAASYNLYGLDQTITGTLEPVSSINGTNGSFFYTTSSNVNGDGSAKTATYVAYVENDTFDENYGFTTASSQEAYGYKDYVFYIQAINADTSARNLIMDRCNLTYDGSALGGSDLAWRVAVFAKTVTVNNAADIAENLADSDSNLLTILRRSTAAYFTSDQAVSNATTKAAVNAKIDDAATIGSITAGSTAYYKIAVRLWLEGEDTTCNNMTYAPLTEDYRLDLSFKLDADPGVAVLGSTGSAIATASTKVGTVTLSGTTEGNIENGEKAASFAWYIDTANSATDAAITSGATGYDTYRITNDEASAKKVYCLVTTDRGNVYRTNTIDLAAKE